MQVITAGKDAASLKVRPSDRDMVMKIAAHRGLTMVKLFAEPDFQLFLRNALRAEMAEESKRLEAATP